MDTHILLATHFLPLWFLVLALFLPRLSIFLMYLQHPLGHFEIEVTLIPLIVWLLLPRALVLYLIYTDLGIGFWFILHVVAALMVWGGSGRYHSRRRTRRDDFD